MNLIFVTLFALVTVFLLINETNGECCPGSHEIYHFCADIPEERRYNTKEDSIIFKKDFWYTAAQKQRWDEGYGRLRCVTRICPDGETHGFFKGVFGYCGVGSCNIFGCNCDDGCRMGIDGNPDKGFLDKYGFIEKISYQRSII